MSLNHKDIAKIAHLARLAMSEQDMHDAAQSLTRILGLIEQMNAVEVADVAPMSHPHEASLRLRDDAVSEPDRRDDFLRVAPAAEAGLYLVPKVIE